MRLTAEILPLRLRRPFRITHGTSVERRNVLVRLGEGLGEAALPPYYPTSAEDVIAYVAGLDADDLVGDDPLFLEDALDRLPPGPAPARAAVDMALHDVWARQLGQPLYRLWGLNPARAPRSSVTLSIPDDAADLRREVAALAGWPILKLKLGAGSIEADEALVRTVREATDAALAVDANGAWTVEEAATIIPRLAAFDLLFIEEPLPKGDAGAWHRLRQRLPADAPPLFADESAQGPEDVLALAGVVDGINVKLAKTGGLRGARRLIALARALGLKVLLGCMVESAVATTAAAHLAPLADFTDLDGPLYLANDPFVGMRLEKGRIVIPEGPGVGVAGRSV